MRKLVTMETDRSHVKLTIARDEIRIKFPKGFLDKQSYITMSEHIAAQIDETETTLRGEFYPDMNKIVFVQGNRRYRKFIEGKEITYA